MWQSTNWLCAMQIGHGFREFRHPAEFKLMLLEPLQFYLTSKPQICIHCSQKYGIWIITICLLEPILLVPIFYSSRWDKMHQIYRPQNFDWHILLMIIEVDIDCPTNTSLSIDCASEGWQAEAQTWAKSWILPPDQRVVVVLFPPNHRLTEVFPKVDQAKQWIQRSSPWMPGFRTFRYTPKSWAKNL